MFLQIQNIAIIFVIFKNLSKKSIYISKHFLHRLNTQERLKDYTHEDLHNDFLNYSGSQAKRLFNSLSGHQCAHLRVSGYHTIRANSTLRSIEKYPYKILVLTAVKDASLGGSRRGFIVTETLRLCPLLPRHRLLSVS